MSRIDKTSKYAMLWLRHMGMSNMDIAKELKLSDKQVKHSLDNYDKMNKATNNISEDKKSTITPKNLMITESQNGKHKVAIMTKAASELSDSARKHNLNHSTERSASYIYRPNNAE
jgi:predicted transcriptional regulator